MLYSAKNNNIKPVAPYSTLKPDTSSDSLSAKSKGVRLVSAKIEISHINNTFQKIKINQIYDCEKDSCFRLNVLLKIIILKIKKESLTS